jgi:hypothetical protein
MFINPIYSDPNNKEETDKKTNYTKVIIISIGVTTVIICGSLLTYYIYNCAFKINDKNLADMNKKAYDMNSNLVVIDKNLKDVSKRNTSIKDNLEIGISKIEDTKKNISKLSIKVDQRLNDLKLIGQALEELNHSKEEIEKLKKNAVVNRRLHKFYVIQAFNLINESKKQHRTINELIEIINDIKVKQNIFESKELIRKNTQSSLIKMNFDNKKQLVEIQKFNDEFIKKYISTIDYKTGLNIKK